MNFSAEQASTVAPSIPPSKRDTAPALAPNIAKGANNSKDDQPDFAALLAALSPHGKGSPTTGNAAPSTEKTTNPKPSGGSRDLNTENGSLESEGPPKVRDARVQKSEIPAQQTSTPQLDNARISNPTRQQPPTSSSTSPGPQQKTDHHASQSSTPPNKSPQNTAVLQKPARTSIAGTTEQLTQMQMQSSLPEGKAKPLAAAKLIPPPNSIVALPSESDRSSPIPKQIDNNLSASKMQESKSPVEIREIVQKTVSAIKPPPVGDPIARTKEKEVVTKAVKTPALESDPIALNKTIEKPLPHIREKPESQRLQTPEMASGSSVHATGNFSSTEIVTPQYRPAEIASAVAKTAPFLRDLHSTPTAPPARTLSKSNMPRATSENSPTEIITKRRFFPKVPQKMKLEPSLPQSMPQAVQHATALPLQWMKAETPSQTSLKQPDGSPLSSNRNTAPRAITEASSILVPHSNAAHIARAQSNSNAMPIQPTSPAQPSDVSSVPEIAQTTKPLRVENAQQLVASTNAAAATTVTGASAHNSSVSLQLSPSLDPAKPKDNSVSLLVATDTPEFLSWDTAKPNSSLNTLAPHIRADVAPYVARQLGEVAAQAIHRPVEIALSPQELGRVRMSIVAEDGTITINIIAERADTLDLMRRHIDQLGQSFRNMGYDQINFAFGQGAQQGEGKRDESPDNFADNDAGDFPNNVSRAEDATSLIILNDAPNSGVDIRL